MASDARSGLEIGEVLKEARRRASLEISTVEERTKIRTRYLRALENQQWDVLPGHTYTKGFLRTYANLLGLDADALLDEYRHSVESSTAGRYGSSEPWTPAHLSPDDSGGGPRLGRGVLLAGIALAVVGILLVLGLTSGGDDGPDGGPERTATTPPVKRQRDSAQPKDEARRREKQVGLALALVAHAQTPVCVLDERGKRLFEGTLAAGEEKAYKARAYELRFPGGWDPGLVNVRAGGAPVKLLDSFGPSSYRVGPEGKAARPRELPAGAGCP